MIAAGGRPCDGRASPSERPPAAMRRARPKRIAAGGRSYHWTMRAHGAGRDDPGIEPGTREMTSSAFTPLRLGPLTLRNRFIKSATNEGMAKGGVPSKLLVEHHRSMAAGGAAMTTVAYCAVEADGRTFEDQVTLDDAPALTAAPVFGGIDQHQSFELLRRLSSTTNVKLRDVAAQIVETRAIPHERVGEPVDPTQPVPVVHVKGQRDHLGPPAERVPAGADGVVVLELAQVALDLAGLVEGVGDAHALQVTQEILSQILGVTCVLQKLLEGVRLVMGGNLALNGKGALRLTQVGPAQRAVEHFGIGGLQAGKHDLIDCKA